MDLNKVTYFVITGASRGIGQTMAIECAKKFSAGSLILLMARSEKGLETTKNKIMAVNNSVTVKIFSIDLSKASKDEMQQAIQSSLVDRNVKDFDRAFVIHNAGSPGDSTKSAKDLGDLNCWVDYYKMNMFSVCILNSVFMQTFQSVNKLIVNITSLCGIEPFKSLAYYCSGKAAREMFFKVLATEEPDVVVLNYSPGPVDTDMARDIQRNTNDNDLRDFFTEQFDKKIILTTQKTTEKFIRVLEEAKFKSGAHVDFFDE